MSNFTISKALFEQFPHLRVGVIVVKGFDNKSDNSEFLKLLRDQEAKQKEALAGVTLSENTKISSWRAAYSSFGAKPKKYKCSVEALLKRVQEGEELPNISPLVNVYNMISIKYVFPVGADDLTKMTSDSFLTYASGKETFLAIGAQDTKNPGAGEIIYRMDQKVLCRRWNWRESEDTKIDENSKEVIIYIESLIEDDSDLKSALAELTQLVNGESFILDGKNNSFDISNKTLSTSKFNERHGEVIVVEEKKKKDRKEQRPQENKSQSFHWADHAADQVIKAFPDEEVYTVASGVTPSGIIHAGHFREVLTSELTRRALEHKGKKTRFIYSWDSHDVFRKVPSNVPEEYSKYLGLSDGSVPDPDGCHENFAEHFMQIAEKTLSEFNFPIEFQRQHLIQTSGEYADGIRDYLRKRDDIRPILDKFRKEPLPKDWIPLTVYSEKTGKDTTKVLSYDEEYTIEYECLETGFKNKINFKETPIVKLPWRLDWPMRWAHYQVCYEPGGKDHSTPGGSFDTGKEIVKVVSNRKAPVYTFYNFISMKGEGGKISSSVGKGATFQDILDIYTPEIMMHLYVGTRPQAEFSISFDSDVIKNYEDYDKLERIYFGLEEVTDEKKKAMLKRTYELCQVEEIPKTIPYQPAFRHLTTMLQLHEWDVEKTIAYFSDQLIDERSKTRLLQRAKRARNWVENHAPDEFVFKIRSLGKVELDDSIKQVLIQVANKLEEKEWDEIDLHEEMYVLLKRANIDIKSFFTGAYQVLIGKEKGPKLAAFILTIGRLRVAELFKNA